MPQFKPYLQGQAQLLPPRLDEMINKDHLVRLINHAVDAMDFSAIENTYSSKGQHGYHPKMLAKVLIYTAMPQAPAAPETWLTNFKKTLSLCGCLADNHLISESSLILEKTA